MRTKSPEDANVIIQKLPSDMGIHRNPRKGTLNAPEEILDNLKFKEKVLVDEIFPDEFDLKQTQEEIMNNTRELSAYGGPLVSVGGDHSVTYPAAKVLKQKHQEMELLWLDAHLDVKEKVEDHVSHDVVVRQLVEENIFEPEEVHFVGITRIDEDEKKYIADKNFNFYRPDEVKEFLEDFKGPAYLSIDVDVLAPKYAEGTGYPDGALDLEAVLEIINSVKPIHADLVEVAPPFDEGKTVESARRVLSCLVGCAEEKD